MDNLGNAFILLVIFLAIFLFQGDPNIHDLAKQWLIANL